ncbi:MAG: hypothetical protein DMG78_06515 [Acidobacteria bacterium]|nr:MAG: hypothetical protein DMG78_06515 [Acidobacteriota bacterium]
MLLMSYAKIRPVNFLVTQLQTGSDKPSPAEAEIEDRRTAIFRQVGRVLVRRVQHHRLVFCLLPCRVRLPRSVPSGHAAIDFCDEGVGIHGV